MFGAYCHFGFLHTLVFLMYLDRRNEMAQLIGVFLGLTVGGTYLAVTFGPTTSYWAMGYVVASLVSMIYAIRRTLFLADRIDYLLLFKQDLRDAEQQLITFVPAADGMNADPEEDAEGAQVKE
jgi:uncharacterized membrane protein